jgi:hypothetical protein
VLTDKHEKLQYFSSAVCYYDLAVSLKKQAQSQPGLTTHPKSHLTVCLSCYTEIYEDKQKVAVAVQATLEKFNFS